MLLKTWIINGRSLCDAIINESTPLRTRGVRCETFFNSKFRILYSRTGYFAQLQSHRGKHGTLEISINALQKSKHTYVLIHQPCSLVTIYTQATAEKGAKRLCYHSSFIETIINQRQACKKLGYTSFFHFCEIKT